jgi:adenylylsulfate kinase-like enzyme
MTHKRIFFKSFAYRVFSFAMTFGISYLFTGNPYISASIGLWDSVSKFGIYYLFEYLVDKVWYKRYSPCVIWLSGRIGSGKSTITKRLKHHFHKYRNNVIIINMEYLLSFYGSYNLAQVRKNYNLAKVVCGISKELIKQGNIVIIDLPVIDDSVERNNALRIFGQRLFIVHVDCDLITCASRKPKEYASKDFDQWTINYKDPVMRDVKVNSRILTPNEASKQILKHIKCNL